MEPFAIVPLVSTIDPAAVFAAVTGEAPLVRVIRSVRSQVAEARIVVATAAALAADARACLREARLEAVGVAVAAGDSRCHVLRAGLQHLGVQRNSPTSVLICDVHHPLSPGRVADRVVAALREGRDVVVPTLPVTDTVKGIDPVGRVLETVDRSTLRAVQYPRGFTAAVLWDLICGPSAAVTDDGDEFVAAMRAGRDIGTVDGDASAARIELPGDEHLLEALIACRSG